MKPQDQYVKRVLDQYKILPGTLGRVLRQDRKTALAFYQRGVGLEVLQSAFILALARRAFRTGDDDLEPLGGHPKPATMGRETETLTRREGRDPPPGWSTSWATTRSSKCWSSGVWAGR